MKKTVLMLLCASMLLGCMSCGRPDPYKGYFEGINGEIYSLEAETYLACEVDFTSDKEYSDPFLAVSAEAHFVNLDSGESFVMPMFWNGGRSWKLRFFLPSEGRWAFTTSCSDTTDLGLQSRGGKVLCKKYSGELDIYAHGFPKVSENGKYFVYADGTPFFYLGDTHWSLPLEDLDSYGDISAELAKEYGVTSQFEYIMDFRAQQGYTVIQSQQLGYYNGASGNSWLGNSEASIFTLGINAEILEKLSTLDRYFAYIAKKGLVHAHTQFSYPEELIESYLGGEIDDGFLERLCRYWVARYAAYPVIWATAQEADNDHYGYGGCTPENNPWKKVIAYISKHDPYNHLATAHQENSGNTTVKNSVFGDMPEHDFYAAQYTFELGMMSSPRFEVYREYVGAGKPYVNYEGRYDHFWTGSVGAMVQGWLSMLNGACGFGYGVQPIWNIFWAGNNVSPTASDELGEFTTQWNWIEGLHAEAGKQLCYMKDFLTELEWWKLEPCFDDRDYYRIGKQCSAAHIGSELYVAFFFGDRASRTGRFLQMEDAEYEIRWFNASTGEFLDSFTVTPTDGEYDLPDLPDESHAWAITAKKK